MDAKDPEPDMLLAWGDVAKCLDEGDGWVKCEIKDQENVAKKADEAAIKTTTEQDDPVAEDTKKVTGVENEEQAAASKQTRVEAFVENLEEEKVAKLAEEEVTKKLEE